MDSATEDLYLQKIEELVCDEGKILSFKHLSQILSITSTDSRRLLEQFIRDQRNSDSEQFAVTYILIGIKDNNPYLEIVKEDDLNSKESELQQVYSKLIYSIQKCKEIDFNAIHLSDHSIEIEPDKIPDSIISKNCTKRVFKVKKTLPVPATTNNNTTKLSAFTNAAPKIEKTEATKEKVVPKPKANSGGIANFFSKAPNKSPKVEQKIEPKPPVVIEEKNKLKRLIDSDSDDNFIESKVVQKETKPEKKKQKKNNSNNNSAKKRKRIVQKNDSDSDDIFGDENEEIVASSGNESEPIFIPTTEPVVVPKNKKRKQVSKTYTDEDGYIQTKKEWVYESASDQEPEIVKVEEKPKLVEKQPVQLKEKPKVVAESNVTNGKSAKGKGGKGKKVLTNQPTLTNFFQRK